MLEGIRRPPSGRETGGTMPEFSTWEWLWLGLKIGVLAFGPYLLILAGLIWLALRHFG